MRRNTQDYKGTKEVEGFVDEKTITNITRLPSELPHKFSYIVAIFIHNHFESPNK
jgi:hypothetical protein